MSTEKRLIDMDDTMNKLRAYAERKHEAEHYELANGILKAVNYIRNNIVRVDAVEVVRCKDCKYFVQGEPYDPCECRKWMVKFGVAYTTPDGYCHKAERKDENP